MANDFIGYGSGNKIALSSSSKWALEASGVYGPFALQGEYFKTSLTTASHDKVNMDSWYAFASWFITGESRRYKKSQGGFNRVKPTNDILSEGGWGAFEVAYRYSYLDMSAIQSVGGNLGRQYNSTIGLNWYPVSTVKFMANYVFAQSAGHPTTTAQNNHYNAFQLRAQIDF